MNTIDRNFLINHGFQEDTDKKVLLELFTKHSKLRELDVSVNLTEHSMLQGKECNCRGKFYSGESLDFEKE